MQEDLRRLEVQLVVIETAVGRVRGEPRGPRRAQRLAAIGCVLAAVVREYEAALAEAGAGPGLRLVVGGD